jgi:HK97 family phage major capsid protein
VTVEEILAALQAIIDGAVGDAGEPRDLNDEESARYEQLEKQLAVVRRSNEIRARQQAYTTPVNSYLVASGKPDDGLERAFEAYLRTGQVNQDLTQLRAQGVGTSAGGGYVVPDGFRQKIVEVQQAYGGLAEHVDSFTTSEGNPIEYPTLDDTDNQGSITAESAAVSSGADLVFGSVRLGAYKYTSAGAGSNLPLRVSVELLQDSAFDVVGLVSRALGTRIARKQAQHWLTGTGVGEPLGLVASSLTADNELDTPDTVDYDDLMDTYDALDPAYEQNAKWIMKKNTWSQIRGIIDGAQRPIIQGTNEGIGGKPAMSLLGFPVVLDQGMPTLSSAADGNAIAFGDFREAYVIRRVSDLTVVVNPYTRAANGEVEYTAWQRADGNIQNRSAYIITQNNT